MDNSASPSPEADASSRRRSGRVTRAPNKFNPDTTAQSSGPKRKRGANDDDDVDDPASDSDDDGSEASDPDSDVEHQAPKSRKQASNRASRKKPKTNGASAHAAALPSRPKKGTRIDAGERSSGLFGMRKHLADG